MMPVLPRQAPKSKDLEDCIDAYRAQLNRTNAGAVWDNFRKSKCGARWLLELQKAYGERCVYCDHAPGRTIDHRRAKSRKAEATLVWSNWCLSCGDCNRLKGGRAVVDPLKEDPRGFIVFDVVTGAPEPNPKESPRRRKKGADTIGYLGLHHQTLNDARRSKRERVLRVLASFVQRKKGYDQARVLAELEAAEPHRAILRDMILDVDVYPSVAPIIRKAIAMLPHLTAWAAAPLQSTPRRR